MWLFKVVGPHSNDLHTSLPIASNYLHGHASVHTSPQTQPDQCYPDLSWPASGYSIDVKCVFISRVDYEEWVSYPELLVFPSNKEAGALRVLVLLISALKHLSRL